jgi:hypothetical protein
MNEELYNLYTRAFVNAKTQEERDFIIACKDKLEGDLTALKTLKNALTIETTPIAVNVDFNKDDGLTIFAKKLYEIKQNQLDFDLRQNLRDWVLKNACPKEYKTLKEIITLHNEWLAHQKSDFEFFTLLNEIVCKYDLKEVVE